MHTQHRNKLKPTLALDYYLLLFTLNANEIICKLREIEKQFYTKYEKWILQILH